jgi:hypothetical protein
MNEINEQIQAKNREIYQSKIGIDTNKNIETFNLIVANLIDIMFFKKKSLSQDDLKKYKEEIKKILSSRNEKLLKNISEADIFDKNLESMVDDVSKKFNEDILKLETNHKLSKDINKKIIAEEKNKSQSLKNSYSETKKYINNIDNLNMSVNKGKVKVYQKENIPKIGTNYETN